MQYIGCMIVLVLSMLCFKRCKIIFPMWILSGNQSGWFYHPHQWVYYLLPYWHLVRGITTTRVTPCWVITRGCLWAEPQAPLTPSNWSALYRGRGSPVMSWILLKANNAQRASGVGDKRFFRFKRNVQHLWTAIIRHRVNYITHQQVMRFNQWSKFANIFLFHLKNPQCFRTLAQPFHFLPNTPVMTQWIFTGPARVEWLWINDFSHNEYHIWQEWPSTCWHVGNKLPKYEVPVFIAQTRNHWRKWKGCASVPKNGLPNRCD